MTKLDFKQTIDEICKCIVADNDYISYDRFVEYVDNSCIYYYDCEAILAGNVQEAIQATLDMFGSLGGITGVGDLAANLLLNEWDYVLNYCIEHGLKERD